MKKKRTVKNKSIRKKKTPSHEDVLAEEMSLLEEEKDKCIISFPVIQYARNAFDVDLGLIGILAMNKVIFNDAYTKPREVIFAFDKKDANKIRKIEKAYFAHEIQIDAQGMSELTMFVVNFLKSANWRKNIGSKRKRHPKK